MRVVEMTRYSLAYRIPNSALTLCLTAAIFFGAACSKDPHKNAEEHFARAQAFLKQNKSEEALLELRRAIQLDPQLTKAHFELANLYLLKHNSGLAARELSLTVEQDPANHEAQLKFDKLI